MSEENISDPRPIITPESTFGLTPEDPAFKDVPDLIASAEACTLQQAEYALEAAQRWEVMMAAVNKLPKRNVE
jgi:hypothetical protein